MKSQTQPNISASFELTEKLAAEHGYKLVKNVGLAPQIVLESKHLAALSKAMDGRIFKTAEDVVKVFTDNLQIKVGDMPISIDPVDAGLLKEQFPATGMLDYGAYINAVINEALSLYLWGSTRGLINV